MKFDNNQKKYFSQYDITDQDPWPGLLEYTERNSSFFYGRNEELSELLTKVKYYPLTILFGKSGQGKTSLLQAGLFPMLRNDSFLPIPVKLDFSIKNNDLISQVKYAINTEIENNEINASKIDNSQTLWEFFHKKKNYFWGQYNELIIPVLVFDQFEEIFSNGLDNKGALININIKSLLKELMYLIENRPPDSAIKIMESNNEIVYSVRQSYYRVIFSLREDFLPDLESLRQSIPQIMNSRFRLTELNGSQAFDIVYNAGKQIVKKEDIESIIRISAGDKYSQKLSDLKIFPALLSLTCTELNRLRQEKGLPFITNELIEYFGKNILQDFYFHTIAEFPPFIQIWIEENLITFSGNRKSVALDDSISVYNISTEVINKLIKKRLLRIDEQYNTKHIALTHDVLTNVIKESRINRQKEESLINEKEKLKRLKKQFRKKTAVILLIFFVLLGFVFQFWNAKNEKAISMAKIYATYGHEAKRKKDFGLALINYNNALKQSHINEAIYGAADAYKKFIPELINFKNKNSVSKILFSPDGRYFVFSSNNDIFVMKTNPWDDYSKFSDHNDDVNDISFHPKLPIFASASNDKTDRVWDIENNNLTQTFNGHNEAVVYVCFMQNSDNIISISYHGKAKIWNYKTKTIINEFVCSNPFSYNSKINKFAFIDPTGKINLLSDIPKFYSRPIENNYYERFIAKVLQFGEKGKRILKIKDNNLKIYNTDNLEKEILYNINKNNYNQDVQNAFISSFGLLFIATHTNINILDTNTIPWTWITSIKVYNEKIKHMEISPDDNHLITVSNNNIFRLWNIKKIKKNRYYRDHEYPITNMTITEGKNLLTRSLDKIIIQDIDQKNEPININLTNQNNCIFFDKKYLIKLNKKSHIIKIDDIVENKTINLKTKQNTIKLNYLKFVNNACLSNNLKMNAFVFDESKIAIYKSEQQNCIMERDLNEKITRLCFSNDDSMLVTIMEDNTACIFMLNLDFQNKILRGHEALITSLSFSPNNKYFATGSLDKTIRIWDIENKNSQQVLRFHNEQINDLTFINDFILASVSNDGLVCFWNIFNKKRIASFEMQNSIQSIFRQIEYEKVSNYFNF